MANKPVVLSAGALAEASSVQVGTLYDANGNIILATTPTASAVNYFTVHNRAAGNPPYFEAVGSDTNIAIGLLPKGNGAIYVYQPSGAVTLQADGTDANVDINLITKATGVLKANGLPVKAFSMIRQHTSYTLSNSAAAQKLFNGSTNGRVTLPVGAYRFNCLISLSSMSTTSGNSAFSLAGTATLGAILMDAIGRDGATDAVGTRDGVTTATAAFPASMQTGTTSAGQQSRITGTFEVTVTGTVIPTITLANAAAAVVAAGSYFECWYLGATTTTSIGAWD